LALQRTEEHRPPLDAVNSGKDSILFCFVTNCFGSKAVLVQIRRATTSWASTGEALWDEKLYIRMECGNLEHSSRAGFEMFCRRRDCARAPSATEPNLVQKAKSLNDLVHGAP